MVKNTSKRRTAVNTNDTQKVNSANDHQNSDSIALVDTNTNAATSNTNIDGNIPSTSANYNTTNSIKPPSAAGNMTASQSTSKNNIDGGHQPSNNNNDNIAMDTSSTTDIPTNTKNDNAAISNSQPSFTGSSQQPSGTTNSQTLAADGTSQNNPNSNNPNSNNEGLSERQQKIIASIKHRKLLLEWVKVSRIECERLAGEYNNNSTSVSGDASGDNLAANAAGNREGSASNGNKKRVSFITEMINSQPPSLLQSTSTSTISAAANLHEEISLSSTKEIQNYQTLTKIATNHTSSSTKKQQYRLPSSKLSPSSKVGKRSSGGTNNRSLPTKANRNNNKLPNVPLLGKQLTKKQGSNKNVHQQNTTSLGASGGASGNIAGGVGGVGAGGEETKKKKGRKRKSTTSNNTEGIISLPGGMLSNKHSTTTKGTKTKSTTTVANKNSGKGGGNKNSGKGAKGGQLQQPSHVPSASAINLLIRKDVLLSKLNDVLVDRENKKRKLLQEHEDGAKVKEKEKGDGNMDKREGRLEIKGQRELQKTGVKEQSEEAKVLLQKSDVRNEGMDVDAAEGSNTQPKPPLTTSKSTDDLAAATANIMSNDTVDTTTDKQNDTTTTITTFDKKKFQGPLQLRGPSSLETSIIKATDATLSQINNELLSRGSIELSQIASSSSALHKSSIGSMYQRLYTKSTSTPDPTTTTKSTTCAALEIRKEIGLKIRYELLVERSRLCVEGGLEKKKKRGVGMKGSEEIVVGDGT